jgi:3-(3-hydroxy-phenyl)propionate hydroxylase
VTRHPYWGTDTRSSIAAASRSAPDEQGGQLTPHLLQSRAHRALAADLIDAQNLLSEAERKEGSGWRMAGHAVVIAGGGPTGMMLGAELTLAGIDVVIVERRAGQELDGSRSGGLHSRTIEVLDQRGIAERFLAEGQAMQVQAFAGVPLDISDFPTRHNYGLALWQSHFERILASWVSELGVPIVREREVIGFTQDDTGVDVELSGGQSLRSDYLVGCDGGRSVIRKAAGIEFPGWDPSTSWLIAEVEMDEEPDIGLRGGGGIGRGEGGSIRVVLTEQHVEHTSEPTLHDVSEALMVVDGTDYGVHSPRWISRFTDTTRQAASYRKGRVLLAGDAAHVHPPQGGQGLNTGVQDAVNLGWKLAQVVNGTSPDGLLDTYHIERHPVGAEVLHNTMAQGALRRTDERTDALRGTLTEMLGMDEPRKRVAGSLSGLDIHYDLGEGHPLLGRRMPDLDLVAADGPLRVFTLLHDARPALLQLGEPGSVDIRSWADRVQLIDAEYVGPWEIPVLGAITAPTALLIRPDGYVAWVGDGTDTGLREALTTWFGSP